MQDISRWKPDLAQRAIAEDGLGGGDLKLGQGKNESLVAQGKKYATATVTWQRRDSPAVVKTSSSLALLWLPQQRKPAMATREGRQRLTAAE